MLSRSFDATLLQAARIYLSADKSEVKIGFLQDFGEAARKLDVSQGRLRAGAAWWQRA